MLDMSFDLRAPGCVLLALVAAVAELGCSFKLDAVQGDPGECSAGFASCAGGATRCETDLRTTSAHCGACSHSCLGGACTDGRCQTALLGGATGRPYGIALDSEFVYFIDNTGGTVNKVAKSGDPTSPLVLASGQIGVNLVAAEAELDGAVFFTLGGPDGGVSKVNKTPGPVTVVASVPDAWEIALDQTDVYFTAVGGLYRVPKTGGAPTRLATLSDNPGSVAIDGDTVYFNDKEAGTVNRLPKDGSSTVAEVLANLQAMPDGIAVDQSNVYWTCYGGEAVARCSKQDASDRQTLASDQSRPNGIAADGAFVYYTAHDSGTVSRVSMTGGEPLLLARCDTPLRVALDESYTYFTASGRLNNAPGVFRVPK
ncbi:MAG: SMP-30/gluconolactonase/LRE family protein [Polyangiaceae bacterium]|nr:SMP-30/gluconolactonase/LRE family protein [Polyangiaceae bacterium]